MSTQEERNTLFEELVSGIPAVNLIEEVNTLLDEILKNRRALAETEILQQPVEALQDDIYVLDAVKGLEAYAEMVASAITARFREFDDVEADAEESSDPEPVDHMHHFIRETRRNAKGARQQLEQRIFSGKR